LFLPRQALGSELYCYVMSVSPSDSNVEVPWTNMLGYSGWDGWGGCFHKKTCNISQKV